jgi:endonuclease/exonuclease/phosphatase family metal-dependent hydrolase
MAWFVRKFLSVLLVVSLMAGGLIVLVYGITYHPAPVETADLECIEGAPVFSHESSVSALDVNGSDSNAKKHPAVSFEQPSLSVMTYNVQYFAGKGYVFYYDLKDNAGPDIRPAATDVQLTLKGVANLIRRHDPDIIFFQELHEQAAATDHMDQLQSLLTQLADDATGSTNYPCYASTHYWKADFVPHPKIMGSVGLKLVTLSKYRIRNAVRRSLPQPPMDWVSAQFYLKRAILEVELETRVGPPWILLNTHFDAFAQGSDTMEKQVGVAMARIAELDQQQIPWILGGDFNLIPPGAYSELAQNQRYLYRPKSEISPLISGWPSIPSLASIKGHNSAWYTHYPNDPGTAGPDRTIDYLFYSRQLMASDPLVDQSDEALSLSDHLPVSARFRRRN